MSLNKNILAFTEFGYTKVNIENMKSFQLLENQIKNNFNNASSLDCIHLNYQTDKLNDHRMAAFRSINSLVNWEECYFSLASNAISKLLGSDILIQNKLNLSIQMPGDESSQLSLHTDTLSGQSEFEIVLWVPFTKAFDTNSMFIFDLEKTKEIYSRLSNFEREGMNSVYNNFKDHAHFVNLEVGEALIFSPTLFHGNVVNKTNSTRVSINCRFKSLFSPEFEGFPTERRVGSFYKMFSMSPVTSFALKHDDSKVEFSND